MSNECDYYRHLEELGNDGLPEPITDYDIELWEQTLMGGI